jgi:flagellar protein FliO/FliZ
MTRLSSTAASAWLLLGVYTPGAYAQTAAMPAAGFGQMLLGLTAVIGVVFALAWLARRLGVPGQSHSPLLRHIAALSVGSRERVLIVEAGEQWLVLGVTAHSIRTLHLLPKGVAPELPALRLPGGFAALLQKAGAKHA